MKQSIEVSSGRTEACQSLKTMSAMGELPRQSQLVVDHVNYSWVSSGVDKQLLRNISINLHQEELCAIMGPSGAGKSTLLDVIAGRKLAGKWSGNLFVDGVIQHMQTDAVRCAYVIQQDLHIGTLTVEETINFAVQLRLGSALSAGERRERIEHLLRILSLTAVKDCRVGDFQQRGLSGGQLKRLSIAVEMVADQTLLLLDEPTSGLDSLLSLEVISAMRNIVSEGRIAIASIHQPSRVLLEMFDKVLVLVRGRVFYFGPVSSMVDYFSSPPLDYPWAGGDSGASEDGSPINPAEYVLGICCGHVLSKGSLVRRTARELEALYTTSKYHQAVQKAINVVTSTSTQHPLSDVSASSSWSMALGWPYPASALSQLYALMHRSWLTRIRDVGDLRAQFAKNLCMGIILGMIYFRKGNVNSPFYEDGYAKAEVQSLASILFQITLVTKYVNMSAIGYLSSSIGHFRREQAANVVSPLVYSITRYLTGLPPLLLQQTLFTIIVYLLTDLPAGASYFFFLLLSSLVGMLTSFAMTMALSANVSTIAMAYSIYPALAEFLITFTGYAIQIHRVPSYWRWATYLSYPRWMFEGLMINHWDRYDTDDYTGDAEDGNGDVLDQYDFNNFDKSNCVAIVALFMAASLVLTYYGLRAPTSYLTKVSVSADSKVSSPSSSVTSSSAVNPLKISMQQSKASATTGLKESLLLPEEKLTAQQDDRNDDGDTGEDPPLPQSAPKLTVESFRASTGVVQAAKGCVLAFKDVCCEVDANTNHTEKSTKVLLKNVNGLVLPGQMCALMGSSGAGKSSLLDVLAQRKTTGVTTGNITYNGSTQLSSFAYVMQDDVHIGSLTVLETISFAAELRLPQNLPADAKKKRVQQLINMMMLGDVSDRIIGGEYARCISGGELKRLSIVVEIVHLPDLMFLDEPTTGLDSSTALEVVSGLRNFANQHRTIICTIHQPSHEIFQLFDVAMVLSDARVAYFGPTSAAIKHFTQSPFAFQIANGVDPADFIVEVASCSIPAADGRWVTAGELAVYYATTELGIQTAANIDATQLQGDSLSGEKSSDSDVSTASQGKPALNPTRRLTVRYQLQLLLGRKFLIIRREWKFYAWLSLCDALLSLFYGSVWYQLDTGSGSYSYTDRLGVLNRANVCMVIKHMDPGYVLNDRRMHYRERNTGAYGHFAYWVAMWLPRLPLELLNSVLFTMFIYPMSGLRVGFVHYLAYLFFSIATNLCSFCLLSTVAALSPTPAIAISVIGLVQMITMQLNGFGVYLPELQDWISWAPYLDFARYGLQGVVVNEFHDNAELPEGQQYIHMMGFQHISVGGCAAIMLLYMVLGGYMLYLALKYVDFEVR